MDVVRGTAITRGVYFEESNFRKKHEARYNKRCFQNVTTDMAERAGLRIVADTYERERSRLLHFIRSRVGSIEESEDILQDVFVRSLSNLNALEGVNNLAAWFYASVRNRIVDWYRGRRDVFLESRLGTDNTTLEEILQDTRISVEESAEQNESVAELIEAIDGLPEQQRFVIIEQAIEGRTFRDFSDETGVPLNTLLARKRYGVRALRQHLINHRDG